MKNKQDLFLDFQKFLSKIPEPIKERRNFFDIGGFPHRETVNSNFLAFYLDEQENDDHGFSRLFFNSLLDVIEDALPENTFSRENFDTDYEVNREVVTNQGRIDLLINDKDEEKDEENNNFKWAIIIENKLNAPLYNNLSDYWESCKCDENKIGVVLSINPIDKGEMCLENGVEFVNITHCQLIEKIQENLSEVFMESDDRHLLFLKEYVNNIKSFYPNPQHNITMEETFQQFQQNQEIVKKFKKTEEKLKIFIFERVKEIMERKNFGTNASRTASKPFFTYNFEMQMDENMKPRETKKLMMWVDLSKLLLQAEPAFVAVLELKGKDNVKYGKELKKALALPDYYSEEVQAGKKSTSNYCHIYKINIPLDNSKISSLEEIINKHFFDPQYIESAIEALENIHKTEKL